MKKQLIQSWRIRRFTFFLMLTLLVTSVLLMNGCISVQPPKPQVGEVIEICDYLGGKRAVVTVSIDSLYGRSEYAPGKYWTDQEGSPFQRLLSFRRKHPQLKITITFVPRNLYSLDVNYNGIWEPGNPDIADPSLADVRNAPDWVKQWILSVQRDFDWIEIADHGLTHSPDGSVDLNKHEFDAYDNPNALNLTWCRRRAKEIREIFTEIGLNNSKIIGFHGPGFRWTDPLIDALVEQNFTYVLVKGFRHHLFVPVIRNIGRGRTFTETFRIHPFYFETEMNNRVLFIPATAHPDDRNFEGMYAYMILKHGVINFFYHFEETIYEGFSERLAFLESFDRNPNDGLNGDELWWCTTGELAKYWIKKENTKIRGIEKRGRTWELEIQSNCSLDFPTSMLLRINPSDISRISCNGRELNWTITRGGAVITTSFPEGRSTILIEFLGEPEIIQLYEEGEEKIAQEIYQTWIFQADRTRMLNGVSLIAIFLLELGTVLAAEVLCIKLRWLKKSKLKYALLLIAVIGFSGWTALRAETLTLLLTATGYEPLSKYLLYLQNIGLNPREVGTIPLSYLLITCSCLLLITIAFNLILTKGILSFIKRRFSNQNR